MKKNYLIVSLVQAFIIITSTILFPATAHSQDLSATERSTLCQREKQDLDKLNEKLSLTSLEIAELKRYVIEMTLYQQQALKYDDRRLDAGIFICLTAKKSFKESLDRQVAGSQDELLLKYKLADQQIKLDYLTAIKTKKLVGEKIDPKNNDLQKAIPQYQEEIDQLEESKKYLMNDITMNKGRISRLRCDDNNTTDVSKNESDTKPGTNLTEDQKQDRCQNNKSRIAELEAQLKNINEDFSKTMTQSEIKDVGTQLKFVRELKGVVLSRKDDVEHAKLDKLARMAAQYNFDHGECFASNGVSPGRMDICLAELEKIISTKIDKAMSLNRQEMLAKKAAIDKQLSIHRNNLIALRCNDINKNNTEEFIKKLVGGWTDKPTPWGTPGGGCQIKYANGKLSLVNENGDESGASISLNSDGSAEINANKWPVTGKVDKAIKSIKWSNNSEWVR